MVNAQCNFVCNGAQSTLFQSTRALHALIFFVLNTASTYANSDLNTAMLDTPDQKHENDCLGRQLIRE